MPETTGFQQVGTTRGRRRSKVLLRKQKPVPRKPAEDARTPVPYYDNGLTWQGVGTVLSGSPERVCLSFGRPGYSAVWQGLDTVLSGVT